MMKCAGIIVILVVLSLYATPQKALVLKNKDNGRAWAIRKGKTLYIETYNFGRDSLFSPFSQA